jgi:phosphomannomutase
MTYAPQIETEFGFMSHSDLDSVRIGFISSDNPHAEVIAERLRGFGAELIELEIYKASSNGVCLNERVGGIDAALRKEISGFCLMLGLYGVIMCLDCGERVLVTDRSGRLIPNDVLGQIAAQGLKAETVVAPRHVNSGLAQLGIQRLILTDEGGEGLAEHLVGVRAACAYDGEGRFFFTGGVEGEVYVQRDDLLPVLALLSEIKRLGSIEARLALEPKRFAAQVDLAQAIPKFQAHFIDALARTPEALKALQAIMADEILTFDGAPNIRMEFCSGTVLHIHTINSVLRFRAIAESSTLAAAEARLMQLIDAATVVSRLLDNSDGAGNLESS